MTDIVEQAARIACPNGPDHDHQPNLDQGCNWALQLCQTLADAGLLRDEVKVRGGVCLECGDGVLNDGEHIDPSRHRDHVKARDSRTVPTREEIGEVVCAKSHYDGNCGCGRDDRTADAVLALLADQPTVAEAKAQALEEFAAHIENTAQRDDVRLTEHAVNEAGGAYLAREQAHEIKDRK